MIVISLVDCPPALRGDLTKWLLEIDAGVFVGRVSARIRDNLWKRLKAYAKNGRAMMVYNAENEQGFDFKTLRSDWEPVDFDGIKLMLRPAPSRIKNPAAQRKPGYSKAARYRMAKCMAAKNARQTSGMADSRYVVIDIETTGFSPEKNEILELAAIKIENGEMQDKFSALIKIEGQIPKKIEDLTGITNTIATESGVSLPHALSLFLEFIGTDPLVAHNARFDIGFLNAACRRHALNAIANECTDTLALARATVAGVGQYTLKALCEYFGHEGGSYHRGLDDCVHTWRLYEKLMNLRSDKK
jgi:CRISPR-associated protein Cas2